MRAVWWSIQTSACWCFMPTSSRSARGQGIRGIPYPPCNPPVVFVTTLMPAGGINWRSRKSSVTRVVPEHRGASFPVEHMTDKRRRFEAQILSHLDAAYRFARWLSASPGHADDVVQDAVLRAFRGFE